MFILFGHNKKSSKFKYCKDTEPLYHSFFYSLVSLLSGIYPLLAMHSLLVTLYVTEYLIGNIIFYMTVYEWGQERGKPPPEQFKETVESA